MEIKTRERKRKAIDFEVVKIIKAAQIRFDQTEFPSKDPCLNYKLGYLQGYRDALRTS